MRKKIAFIVNPVSGTTSRSNVSELIEKIIDREQFAECRIQYTQYKGHGTELAKQLVADSFDFVVAVGGDGTDPARRGRG